jgi:hypothetical protein
LGLSSRRRRRQERSGQEMGWEETSTCSRKEESYISTRI